MVQFFAEDMLETVAHYQKAFNAKILSECKSDAGDLIPLEMDSMDNRIALAHHYPAEMSKEI